MLRRPIEVTAQFNYFLDERCFLRCIDLWEAEWYASQPQFPTLEERSYVDCFSSAQYASPFGK